MGDYGSDDDAVHFPDYGNEEGGQDPRWAPPVVIWNFLIFF